MHYAIHLWYLFLTIAMQLAIRICQNKPIILWWRIYHCFAPSCFFSIRVQMMIVNSLAFAVNSELTSIPKDHYMFLGTNWVRCSLYVFILDLTFQVLCWMVFTNFSSWPLWTFGGYRMRFSQIVCVLAFLCSVLEHGDLLELVRQYAALIFSEFHWACC